MKKLVCLVLVALLVASIACIPVCALEIEAGPMLPANNPKSYIRELAINAFPEYADRITDEAVDVAGIMNYLAENEDSVIIQESRYVSENEVINYTEYASGQRYISFMFTVGKNVTNTSTSGSYTTYTLNAWMDCLGSDNLLMVYNIKLKAGPNGSSELVYKGDITSLTTTIATMVNDKKDTGTIGNPAYVRYVGSFEVEVAIGDAYNLTLVPGYMKVYINSNMQPAVEVNDD